MKLMFIKTFNMHVYNNSECFDASFKHRDFPTFSKQGPGTNDFGKNNTYISQIGKMDTKQNRG